MRNLTQEAMQMAKDQFLMLYPSLSDKEARVALDDKTKNEIFQMLVMFGNSCESLLIATVGR